MFHVENIGNIFLFFWMWQLNLKRMGMINIDMQNHHLSKYVYQV